MNKSKTRAVARKTNSLIFATAVALIALFAGIATAANSPGSGGVGVGGGGSNTGGGGSHSGANASNSSCPKARFGSRTLSRGDCGDDVKTLNFMLKARASRSVDIEKDFKGTTASAVRSFERSKGQKVNGVVEKTTRQALTGSLSGGTATWYGPTLYGNGVACGGTLRRGTVGVAHKTLPCGTKVLVGYKGHWVRTKVIDRGPYGTHAQWDLTEKLAEKLRFKSVGIGKIKFATIKP